MHFAKLRWLNSLSRQLMAASAGGVLFVAGLLLAGLLTLFLFKGLRRARWPPFCRERRSQRAHPRWCNP